MRLDRYSWFRFLARATALTLMISVGVFVSVRLALAVPGEPVRRALTVSGVITGTSGVPVATFRFYRSSSDSTALCNPSVMIANRDPTTGAFSVEVPLDQTGQVCPDALFHDPSAYVEVLIGTTVVVSRRPINPVPYAVFAQQYGTPDCPVGFERESDPAVLASMRLCVRTIAGGRDEVVRVGSGATAFWIDRYESSVYNGAGAAFGVTDDVFPSLARNGRWFTATLSSPPLRAVSRPNVQPSRNMTWFQANELCRASGKRLPTGDEWLAAAQGTDDPTIDNDGQTAGNSRCNTRGAGLRSTGLAATGCFSAWGAQDMIGNLQEWTGEWFAGAGTPAGGFINDGVAPWPEGADYGQDLTQNVAGYAYRDPSRHIAGIPAAVVRGGSFQGGTGAGIYSVSLATGPSTWSYGTGFRCVVPR